MCVCVCGQISNLYLIVRRKEHNIFHVECASIF